MGALPDVRLVQMATIIETEPIGLPAPRRQAGQAGGPPQGPYLNTVVELDTRLTPHELLAALQGIERRLGRVPSAVRWAPRPIDLDLLLYQDQVIHDERLVIPHPRMHERRFVLEPLAQLAPDVLHPVLKQTIAELLMVNTNFVQGSRLKVQGGRPRTLNLEP